MTLRLVIPPAPRDPVSEVASPLQQLPRREALLVPIRAWRNAGLLEPRNAPRSGSRHVVSLARHRSAPVAVRYAAEIAELRTLTEYLDGEGGAIEPWERDMLRTLAWELAGKVPAVKRTQGFWARMHRALHAA